jgi:hypothetical protein
LQEFFSEGAWRISFPPNRRIIDPSQQVFGSEEAFFPCFVYVPLLIVVTLVPVAKSSKSSTGLEKLTINNKLKLKLKRLSSPGSLKFFSK